jgi:uncharacterized membrane protein YfcA
MPVAGLFLSPVWALTLLIVMDIFGPLPNIPRALRDGEPRDVGRLMLGAAVGVPLGVALLTALPVEAFRWGVSLLALALVALLAGGWRYQGRLGKGLTLATGGLGGFLGGSTGLSGPPAILLYMASTLPAQTIRANLLLYLIGVDVLLISVFWASGHLAGEALALALVILPVYLLGNIAGAAIFRPGRETAYRRVAYTLIAASAITGLPIWS